jgi:hypothetical protein
LRKGRSKTSLAAENVFDFSLGNRISNLLIEESAQHSPINPSPDAVYVNSGYWRQG